MGIGRVCRAREGGRINPYGGGATRYFQAQWWGYTAVPSLYYETNHRIRRPETQECVQTAPVFVSRPYGACTCVMARPMLPCPTLASTNESQRSIRESDYEAEGDCEGGHRSLASREAGPDCQGQQSPEPRRFQARFGHQAGDGGG